MLQVVGRRPLHMMRMCIQTGDRWINRQDCNYMYTQELKTSNNCVALQCCVTVSVHVGIHVIYDVI